MDDAARCSCLFECSCKNGGIPRVTSLRPSSGEIEVRIRSKRCKENGALLSTLEWRMNPVIPISFFGHIVRKLSLKSHLHCEFIWRSERVLLVVLADSKVMSYLPSEIAAATMVHVIGEVEPFNAGKYRNQLLGLLKINEEQVNQCYKLVLKILCCHEDIQNLHSRLKRLSEPRSPDGVIDAFFNNDSSNDSWASRTVLVSVSEETMLKKKRSNLCNCLL